MAEGTVGEKSPFHSYGPYRFMTETAIGMSDNPSCNIPLNLNFSLSRSCISAIPSSAAARTGLMYAAIVVAIFR